MGEVTHRFPPKPIPGAIKGQIRDPAERNQFLRLLHGAVTARQAHMRAMTTLRADYYDRRLEHHGFRLLMWERIEVVLPLSPEELAEAIGGQPTKWVKNWSLERHRRPGDVEDWCRCRGLGLGFHG